MSANRPSRDWSQKGKPVLETGESFGNTAQTFPTQWRARFALHFKDEKIDYCFIPRGPLYLLLYRGDLDIEKK
jgi:hypothetical protein